VGGSILVLTRRMDATADLVVDELNRRDVPVVRFDLGEVTVAAELVGSRWVGQLRTASRTTRLEDALGVYYRRPSQPTAPLGTDPPIGAWIETEARWGLRGLLAALPRGLWLNWPPAVHAAEHKPWQLAEAAAIGLRVPRTAITNDPDAAAGFASDAAPVLYKAFRAEPVRIGEKTHLVYATPVDAEQCRSEAVRAAPIMLQTQIDKAFDARVTCVDGHVFAVTPRGAGGAVPLDWRVDHLVRGGSLTDPAWHDAFARVPREIFVPHFFVPWKGRPGWRLVEGDEEWLDGVYSDEALVTQMNGDDDALRAARRGQTVEGRPTLSSSAPSLMAAMLHALDVAEGMTVLEVGTGSGYNAAVLAQRLGDDRVTTIEVDPAVAQRARIALAAAGCRPTVATGDGAAGYPPRARYDRVIATVAFPRVPLAHSPGAPRAFPGCPSRIWSRPTPGR
jgi:protein-L-isoaspartate O-methyltransferase